MRILYLDCDTLRPDHLGAYGYHRTTSPNIDRIAREGVRFDRCFASDTPCLPSRTATFFGRLGANTGVVGHAGASARMDFPGDGHGIDPERRPLAMVLAQHGIHTTTFSTFHQRHLAWFWTAGWNEVQRFTQSIGAETADDLEQPALTWLERNAMRDDWFLHLHFWDPHTPYNTPASFGDPFADEPGPAWLTEEIVQEQLRDWGPLCAADVATTMGEAPRQPNAIRGLNDVKRWIDGYDTGVAFMDATIGRILDQLDAAGVLDDTAIVVTSDHGENLGELNRYASHTTADAITTRVPLIVRWPGMDAGTSCDTPIYQLDLAPTLCDLLGAEPPARWDGRSFAPALRGEPLDARPYLVLGHGAWSVQRAVLADDLIYIRTLHAALDPLPDEMLFDLAADPHEQHDLIESRPEEAARLARLMTNWWHDHVGHTGRDPLLSIVREGGAPYARDYRDEYIVRLRDTGRREAAEELERRWVGPVPDRFDYSRY